MPPRIDLDRDEVERLYLDEDLTLEEVGDELGVSKKTVHNRLIEWGIPRRTGRRRRVPSAEYVEEINGVADDLGRPPTSGEFERLSERTASGACSRFGSWREALRASDLDPNGTRIQYGSSATETQPVQQKETQAQQEETSQQKGTPVWQEEEWLQKRRKEGMTYEEMADEAGCTRGTIYKWTRHYDMRVSRPPVNKPQDGRTPNNGLAKKLWEADPEDLGL